jgi:tetratricopeptide (TPR) repeat protein
MLRRWRFVAAMTAAATVAAAWGAARAYDSWRAGSDLEAAKRAIAGRRTAEAHRFLVDAAARRPGADEVEFLLGASEQALGDVEKADAAWSRVPPGSPFAPHAAMLRARLVLRRDHLADAEPLLLVAVKGTGPLAVEARDTLVNIYKIEGRFAEARTIALEASGQYPDEAALLRELETLGSNNPISFERAHAALDRAGWTAPDDDRVWLGLANLATRSGHFDEAARWLEKCLARRPDDPAVWRAMFDRAFAVQDEAGVERALRHFPSDRLGPSEVLTLAAWFASRAGDAARERKAYEAEVAREPGDLHALARLADLALSEGQPERAAELREQRVELNRIKYEYENRLFAMKAEDVPTLAGYAERLGRYLEARSLWSQAARMNPDDAGPREALERVRRAIAAVPRGPTVKDLLAEIDDAPRKAGGAGTVPPGFAPEFVDDARAAGLVFSFANGATPEHHMPETTAGGVGVLDYDGDGRLDVYVTQAGHFPDAKDTSGDRLFRNKGDGTFEDATDSSGVAAFAKGYGHGVAVGDVDNDGHPDLFITRFRSYVLYRNRSDGTFEDATARYGLGGDRDWPTSAAFGDLDGDGDLDLYVAHYCEWDAEHPKLCEDKALKRYAYCAPQHVPPRPDHLFRNDGGRFVDVTEAAGIVDKDGRGLGVLIADLDGDGKLDIYVANDQSANFLFLNKGGMRFEEAGGAAGVASSGEGTYQASMGIACGDVDGDGRPDLAVTNFYNEYTTLYQNRGGGVFTDATSAFGIAAPTKHRLGFGVALVDVNNDGRLDLATANGHVDDFRPALPYQMPAQLLLGVGGGRMVDATAGAGAPWQVPRVARGLAAGDLDNDGRVDLVVLSHDVPLALFRNRTAGGAWLTLGLEATAGHREAIGARVVVTAGGRRQTAWRVGGGSFQSACDPRLHFGLGGAAGVESVEVTWPSGRVDHYGPMATGVGYLLREGDPSPRPLRGFAGPDRTPAAQTTSSHPFINTARRTDS